VVECDFVEEIGSTFVDEPQNLLVFGQSVFGIHLVELVDFYLKNSEKKCVEIDECGMMLCGWMIGVGRKENTKT
jgi:hypothetical protein